MGNSIRKTFNITDSVIDAVMKIEGISEKKEEQEPVKVIERPKTPKVPKDQLFKNIEKKENEKEEIKEFLSPFVSRILGGLARKALPSPSPRALPAPGGGGAGGGKPPATTAPPPASRGGSSGEVLPPERPIVKGPSTTTEPPTLDAFRVPPGRRLGAERLPTPDLNDDEKENKPATRARGGIGSDPDTLKPPSTSTPKSDETPKPPSTSTPKSDETPNPPPTTSGRSGQPSTTTTRRPSTPATPKMTQPRKVIDGEVSTDDLNKFSDDLAKGKNPVAKNPQQQAAIDRIKQRMQDITKENFVFHPVFGLGEILVINEDSYDVIFEHGIEKNISEVALNFLVNEASDNVVNQLPVGSGASSFNNDGNNIQMNLMLIADKSVKLAQLLSNNSSTENWVEQNVESALDYINNVFEYLNYGNQNVVINPTIKEQ